MRVEEAEGEGNTIASAVFLRLVIRILKWEKQAKPQFSGEMAERTHVVEIRKSSYVLSFLSLG